MKRKQEVELYEVERLDKLQEEIQNKIDSGWFVVSQMMHISAKEEAYWLNPYPVKAIVVYEKFEIVDLTKEEE